MELVAVLSKAFIPPRRAADAEVKEASLRQVLILLSAAKPEQVRDPHMEIKRQSHVVSQDMCVPDALPFRGGLARAVVSFFVDLVPSWAHI
jgi:hypothetical protein